MALQVCCGADGLMQYRKGWQRVSCPLPAPQLIASDGVRCAIADNTQRLLWLGEHLFPLDGGVEKLLLWRGHPLVLSGETNALTLLHPATGAPLFLVPAGIYPQDMCFVSPCCLAVCGGADAKVRLFHLPELTCTRTLPLKDHVQRIACHGGWLYALCDNTDESACSLLRTHPASGRCEHIHTRPGLAGALLCSRHGLWAGIGDALCRFRYGDTALLQCRSGFGMIRYMTEPDDSLLISDVAHGALYSLDAPGREPRLMLQGEINQAAGGSLHTKGAPFAESAP